MEPPVWHNLVVRLWRDGDGLKVRFLAGRNGHRPATLTLATSVESAVHQFEAWLRSIEPEGPSPVQTSRPTATTQALRNGTRQADAGSTDPETAGS